MTFHSVGNVIIQTDELIFFREVGIPPTSYLFGGFLKWWYPKLAGWFISWKTRTSNRWWLGVPPFWETSIFGKSLHLDTPWNSRIFLVDNDSPSDFFLGVVVSCNSNECPCRKHRAFCWDTLFSENRFGNLNIVLFTGWSQLLKLEWSRLDRIKITRSILHGYFNPLVFWY